MMPRTITIDLDSADYGPAVTALEWAFHNARRLQYSLPVGFEVAMALLKGEAKTGLFISSSDGFYSFVESLNEQGTLGFDDFMHFMERRKERLDQRREEQKAAAGVVGEFIKAVMAKPSDGPVCVDCGKPRAKGSAARCRPCYQACSTANASPALLAQNERMEGTE